MCTAFNGASNIVQQGALAALDPEGLKEIETLIDYYMENAAMLKKAMLLAATKYAVQKWQRFTTCVQFSEKIIFVTEHLFFCIYLGNAGYRARSPWRG